MKIVIVSKSVIPANLYGGTERVIWGLAKELTNLGHEVYLLVEKGSECSFAKVIFIDHSKEIITQIPDFIDVVHFHFDPKNIENCKKPYVITKHGNENKIDGFDKNTIFVSKNHAERFGATSFVYNGLNWDDYGIPNFKTPTNNFHFLGKAAWRVKNVKGAINIIKKTKSEKINILGGYRFNLKMGIRFTFTNRASFFGMVGGTEKLNLLNQSKGLIFPVKWHEPFGLAIIESLYFGCPVFATPYGAIPEIVTKENGVLSNSEKKLTEAVEKFEIFSRKKNHEYVNDVFNARVMAKNYIEKYELVLNGNYLNDNKPYLLDVNTPKFLDWFH